MFKRHSEIWYALLAIAAITAVYLFAYSQAQAFPKASGLVGHGIGIVGFLLMLMTETLYSIRKRRDEASWGSMQAWLRFHVFTGLVGPYMVFLHAAMRFQGLAGIAMLLTVIVVLSGVIGRYVYTRIPRSPEDGAAAGVPAPDESEARLAARRRALATWYSLHVPLTWVLFGTAFVHMIAALFYATLQR